MLNVNNYILPFLLFCLLSSACKDEKKTELNAYYWQTNGPQNPSDFHAKMVSYGFTAIYQKVCEYKQNDSTTDIRWIKNNDDSLLFAKRIVPVVRISSNDASIFSEINNSALIRFLLSKKTATPIREIQFDYDFYDAPMRDKYFYFLKRFTKEAAIYGIQDVSITTRLENYFGTEALKNIPYQQTLMLYGFANPDDKGGMRISDSLLSESYLPKCEFPNDISVALPIYGWGTVYRHGKYKAHLSGIDYQLLKSNAAILFSSENTVDVIADCTINGEHLQERDVIFFENSDAKSAKQVLHQFERHYSGNLKEVILFQLDPDFFKWNNLEDVKKILAPQ